MLGDAVLKKSKLRLTVPDPLVLGRTIVAGMVGEDVEEVRELCRGLLPDTGLAGCPASTVRLGSIVVVIEVATASN